MKCPCGSKQKSVTFKGIDGTEKTLLTCKTCGRREMQKIVGIVEISTKCFKSD
jgi:hypothetical protein